MTEVDVAPSQDASPARHRARAAMHTPFSCSFPAKVRPQTVADPEALRGTEKAARAAAPATTETAEPAAKSDAPATKTSAGTASTRAKSTTSQPRKRS